MGLRSGPLQERPDCKRRCEISSQTRRPKMKKFSKTVNKFSQLAAPTPITCLFSMTRMVYKVLYDSRTFDPLRLKSGCVLSPEPIHHGNKGVW